MDTISPGFPAPKQNIRRVTIDRIPPLTTGHASQINLRFLSSADTDNTPDVTAKLLVEEDYCSDDEDVHAQPENMENDAEEDFYHNSQEDMSKDIQALTWLESPGLLSMDHKGEALHLALPTGLL
jgi:hypothetical protein